MGEVSNTKLDLQWANLFLSYALRHAIASNSPKDVGEAEQVQGDTY